MFGRWLIALIVFVLFGLGYGLLTGQNRIDAMSDNIETALKEAGYDWAEVSMEGNVATVSGTATTSGERQAAIRVAQTAACPDCMLDRKWYKVVDATDLMEPVALPTRSPYTFTARKLPDGSVTLSGYAPSQEASANIQRDAVAVFGNDNVAVESIELAEGTPDRWTNALGAYFRKLARLDEGRLVLEDTEGALQGKTSDASIRDELFSRITDDGLTGYNFVGNVSVPGARSLAVGQSSSQTICQGLLDDLKQGRKIGFGPGEAVIRGDDNFDLLGDLASAANQCPSFRIAINGYTSSDGSADFNQELSEDRANAVLFYLTEQGGIDRNRLSARGFGPRNPVSSNETQEGREQNRRIEFIVSTAE